MTKPYQDLDDLPASIRRNWPEKAQQVFLAAYRRTLDKCRNGSELDESQWHSTASDAALLAVRSQFRDSELGAWRGDDDRPGTR